MEAKYGGGEAAEGDAGFEEPTEEEFQAAAARMKGKRQVGTAHSKGRMPVMKRARKTALG